MNRYTIKELESMSNRQLILSLIRERVNGLTNVYAPLSQRLLKLAIWVEKNVPDDKATP